MRYIFSFLVVLFFSIKVLAQNGYEEKIDSLEYRLKTTQKDSSKVKILCRLAEAYGGVDSLKVFENAHRALVLSEKSNYLYGIAYSYYSIGGGYFDYSDYGLAQDNYTKAIEHIESLVQKDSSLQNLKLLAKAYYRLGISYGNQGNNSKEVDYIKKAMPIAKQINDTKFLAIANTNFGIRHMNFGEFEEAYKYFNRSDSLYAKLKNPLPGDIAFDKISFSTCLFQMDSLQSMKKTLDDAKKYLDQTPSSITWSTYYSNLGLYYSGVGDYSKAIKMYDASKKLLEEKKRKGHWLNILFFKYADTYEKMGQYDVSKKYLKEILKISLQNGYDISRAKAYYRLARNANISKDYKDAYQYIHSYMLLVEDTLNVREYSNKIKQLDIQYQTEKKEKEILKLKNEKNIIDLALEKKKSQAYLMVILIITLALALGIGYVIYTMKLKEGRIKEQEHAKEVSALQLEQKAKVFSAMIEGQEKERKRLAIDLHDGLGGRLSAIGIKLSKLDKDSPNICPKQELSIIQEDIKDSLSELRGIARNLMPETLLKYGLKAALEDYCSSMNERNCQLTLQFYEEKEEKVTINKQVTMYRIIQELINNAVKHAKASEVLIQYIHENGKIDIIVEDNGVGFDAKSMDNKKGMGFSNLKTRVDYLNGTFDIQSNHHEGTTVTIEV